MSNSPKTIFLNEFKIDTDTPGDVSFSTTNGKNSYFNHNIRATDFIIADSNTGQEVSLLNNLGGIASGSNGKYSQICLPNDGEVKIDGSLQESVSIISGTGIGSLTFTPLELVLGASYHVKFAGRISSDSKELINMTAYLGDDTLYTTEIDSTDIKIENLGGQSYVYECEFDLTVIESGLSGKIYSNGQLFYVKGTGQNSLRGSSNEYILNKDLTSNLDMDIKIQWITGADSSEYILNKMVRITRMF